MFPPRLLFTQIFESGTTHSLLFTPPRASALARARVSRIIVTMRCAYLLSLSMWAPLASSQHCYGVIEAPSTHSEQCWHLTDPGQSCVERCALRNSPPQVDKLRLATVDTQVAEGVTKAYQLHTDHFDDIGQPCLGTYVFLTLARRWHCFTNQDLALRPLEDRELCLCSLPAPSPPPVPPHSHPPSPPLGCHDTFVDGHCWRLGERGASCTSTCGSGVGFDAKTTFAESTSEAVISALSRDYALDLYGAPPHNISCPVGYHYHSRIFGEALTGRQSFLEEVLAWAAMRVTPTTVRAPVAAGAAPRACHGTRGMARVA